MRLISQEVLELWVHRVPERDGPRFISTIKQFPWNVLGYMLTDEDCPVCCYGCVMLVAWQRLAQPTFFMSGVTAAFLKEFGKEPSMRE